MYAPMAASEVLLPGMRKYFIIYLACLFILLVLTIVDLALSNWYEYCKWEFGLATAQGIDGGDSGSIGDTKDTVCDTLNSNNTTGNYTCPGACDNIGDFKSGGGVMIFFGAVTLATIVASAILHILAFIGRPMKNRFPLIVINLPPVLWLLGTIIYGAVAHITSIDDTTGDATNVTVEGGVALCIVLVLLEIAVGAFGILCTRQAFL